MLLFEQIMLNENTEILNELYVGKTAGIIELENACAELKNVVNTENASATKSDAMAKLNAVIVKEFGFASSEISILPLGFANACTFNVQINAPAIRKKTDLYVYNEKTGIRFNTKYNFKFSGSITAELVNIITAQEFTAILLHEIGHNFQQIRILGVDDRSWLSKLLDMFIDMCVKNRDVPVKDKNMFGKNLNGLITDLIPKDFGKQFKLLEKLHKISNICSVINKMGEAGANAILTGVQQVTAQLGMSFLSRILGKNVAASDMHHGEYFADSFAAMYGYGKDIITGLAKLNKPNDILDMVMDVLTLPLIFVMSPTHPDIVARNINVVQQYRQTLKTDKTLNPEVKKELEIKLQEAEEQLEKLKTIYSFGKAPKAFLSMYLIRAIHAISGEKAIKGLMPKDYSYGLQKDDARVIKEK